MYVFEFIDTDAALEFFKRCQAQNAKTEAERNNVLLEMAGEGLMKRVMFTKRSPRKYIQDTSKYQSVIYIKGVENAD